MKASLKIRAFLALTMVSVVALAGHALDEVTERRSTWPPEVDALYLPPASALKRISLGHTQLFADLLAARTNVYFGDQLVTTRAQKWLHFYLNTVVDLDPAFEPIYRRGAAMLVYGAREMKAENIILANDLLERGLKQFPDDWELWFQLGFNRAFELPQLVGKDDPRAVEWKRQGTEALRRATYFEGIPPHFPSMVARMLTDQGERELAIQHLERTYAVSSDPGVRAHIRGRIVALMGENYVASFEEEARNLARMAAQRYPYAAEAFSLIAGPRQIPHVDLGLPGERER